MRKNLSPNRNQTGQVAVEFAIVFPFILLMFMGLFDVSRAVFAYWRLSIVVDQGLRVAAYFNGIEDDNTTHVDSYVSGAPVGHAEIQAHVADLVNWERVTLSSITISTLRTGVDFTLIVSGSYSPFFPVIPTISITASGVTEITG